MKAILSVLQFPVLHFLVLGLAAFFAYEKLKPAGRETIQVTSQTIDALVQQRESLTLSPITAEYRKELIEGHIEDEVLLREAYKRGFDKNDYRVRKRILTIMRSTLSEVIPEPSDAQLRAYYTQNTERFRTSPSRSIVFAFFNFSSGKLPENPKEFIRRLEEGADAAGLSDFSLLGNTSLQTPFQTLAATFGKPFAETVFNLPLNRWTGPVESFLGIHYLKVTGTHEPSLPPFEKMESYLRDDYLMKKTRESQMRKIEELRKSYRVVVEGEERDR